MTRHSAAAHRESDSFDEGAGDRHPRCDDQAAGSPEHGLPERSRGLTGAVRRQMHAAGTTFFASLLCTTTVLLNSIENAQLLEINGADSGGHFGHMAGSYGILYEGLYKESGWMLDRKSVNTQAVTKVRQDEPAFAWLAPAVRGPPQPGVEEAPGQKRNRQRAQRRYLELARVLSEGACEQITSGREVAWEVPFDLPYWRQCEAEQRIMKAAASCGRKLYDIIVEGCFYKAPEAHGKKWRVMTTSPQLAAALRRCRCPGHKDHTCPSGPVRFPQKLVEDILDSVRWEFKRQGSDVGEQVLDYVMESPRSSEIYAAAVTSLPSSAPTGARLRQVKDNMMRLHRAAGHTSFENLAQLLQRRGSPDWAVALARSLTCDDCSEVRRKIGAPPATAEPPPALWETLGLDVFETEYTDKDGVPGKAKFLVMVDRASRFTMVHFLNRYAADASWEPTTKDIIKAVVRTWMGSNPSPRWLLTDAAPYFTSREMLDFASRSGLGLLTAPAEAHYLLGIEERTIQVLKRTADKLDREGLNLDIESLMVLACHGHNSHVHAATGYSPFQWTRGWQREDALPIGLDPRRAFGRALLLRSKAEEAFTKADASVKLSKLSNSVARQVETYEPGSLCMLWRARANKQRGGWTGPLRVLLQENTTLWLATGTTLVRAKLNQVRPCTEREQLVVSTQGTVVYQNAVGLDILLRGYRGKHFLDASAENPGADLEEDLSPAQVVVQPPERPQHSLGKDSWVVTEDMVIRKHVAPRLTLFTPDRTKDCPLPEQELTGKRRTIIQRPGGAQSILDDYKTADRPRRSLMDRWAGETQFERTRQVLPPAPPEQRAPPPEVPERRVLPPELPEPRAPRPELPEPRAPRSELSEPRVPRPGLPRPRVEPRQGRTEGPFSSASTARATQAPTSVRRGLEETTATLAGPPPKRERRDLDTYQEPPVPSAPGRDQQMVPQSEQEPETPPLPVVPLSAVDTSGPDLGSLLLNLLP